MNEISILQRKMHRRTDSRWHSPAQAQSRQDAPFPSYFCQYRKTGEPESLPAAILWPRLAVNQQESIRVNQIFSSENAVPLK